jgi:hypothetical protein
MKYETAIRFKVTFATFEFINTVGFNKEHMGQALEADIKDTKKGH